MGEPGRFLELATVDNNILDVGNETLESLFENPDTDGLPVAIISVLGGTRTGKSKLLGHMLKYFHDENKMISDDSVAFRIPTFGDDPNKSQKCILAWSKPFIVTKGVKRKVAVYLIDIKGNFMNSNDKEYIKLSGLCTFLSSSVIYLHGDHVDEPSWTHLRNIAAEGLRYIGSKELLVHQQIIYVIQNWNKPKEYIHGDKDSDKFCKNLKDKCQGTLREKVFATFQQFKFFLLPETTAPRYSSLLNKLVAINLDRGYLESKCFGTEIKVRDIPGYIKNHLDEVNYNDDFEVGRLDNFECLKQIEKDQNTVQDSLLLPQSSIARGPSFFDIVNQALETEEVTTEANDTHSSSVMSSEPQNPYTDVQQQLRNEVSSNCELQVTDTKCERVKEQSFPSQKEKIESVSGTSEDDLSLTDDGDIDMTNVSQLNVSDLIRGLPKVNTPAFDVSKFLEPIKSSYQSETPKPEVPVAPTLALSPAEILQQVNKNIALENPPIKVSTQLPKTFTPTVVPSAIYVNPGEFSQPEVHKPFTAKSASAFSMPKEQDMGLPLSKKDGGEPYNLRSKSTTARKAKGPILDQVLLQHTISQIFRNAELHSKKASDDILKEVCDFIGTPELKNDIFGEAVVVQGAIAAVMKYIEAMEVKFQEFFHLGKAEFENLHKDSLEFALKGLSKASYLLNEVNAKINAAKEEFLRHNRSMEKEGQQMTDVLVNAIRGDYEKEIATGSGLSEEKLLKMHEDLLAKFSKAAEKALSSKGSSLSRSLHQQIELELKRIFSRVKSTNYSKLREVKLKADSAVFTAKMYYESEMNGPVRLGVITELTQLENLHETKFSDAQRKFDESVSLQKLIGIPAEFKDNLEKDLLKCYASIRTSFELKFPQNVSQSKPPEFGNASGGQFSQSTVQHSRYQEDIPVGPKPEYGLGIHLEVGGATVSVLQHSKVQILAQYQNLSIGYNGDIILKDSLEHVSSNFLPFNKLFAGDLNERFHVNWGGKDYNFRMEECMAILFSKWKSTFQESLACIIKVCAIAVPAFISEKETKAIYDAAGISGFETIKILRDISSAAVGLNFFPQQRAVSKRFILVNTRSDVWDAGFYDLGKHFSAEAISGDHYVWLINILLYKTNRLWTIINDVKHHLGTKEMVDVILLGNRETISDTKINDIKQKIRPCNVYIKERKAVSDGCAFIAALLVGDGQANNLWQQSHPNVGQSNKYSWKSIDEPWMGPKTSKASQRSVAGQNMSDVDLVAAQEKIRPFVLKREKVIADANSFLLRISKQVGASGLHASARAIIMQRIDEAFASLRATNIQITEIDNVTAKVEQMYRNICV